MYRVIKRLLDILFSLVLIIILFIPMIIILILILIIDRVNPIFIQKRIGKKFKEFNIYKFRTMKNDNYTKFGKVLRVLSIDELPQLFNILKGDMSFVGPRPWIKDYYELMNNDQKERYKVSPGLTGLAQVNGRNSISILKKIDYDLEYVKNISFKLDLYIVLKTIIVVFKKENGKEAGIKKELEILKKENRNVKV